MERLKEWIRLKGTPYGLQYFPDDFDRSHTFLIESELKSSDDKTRKWYSDYMDLMEYKRNPNYGRTANSRRGRPGSESATLQLLQQNPPLAHGGLG